MTPGRLVLATVAAALAACSNPSLSPDVYSRSDAQQTFRVRYGEVVEVRPVPLEGEATDLGTFGGGWIGYGAGRDLADGDSYQHFAGAVGGVAGALAGRAIEKSFTGEDGIELIVELDNGELIGIVQADDVSFVEGERVRVMMSHGRGTRVQKN